jgi:hypothetical protein
MSKLDSFDYNKKKCPNCKNYFYKKEKFKYFIDFFNNKRYFCRKCWHGFGVSLMKPFK